MSAPQPEMVGLHNQVTDGLSPLTNEVGKMITRIGESSSNLQSTLNHIYNLYSSAINEREILVKDIDAVVQGSKDATQRLAAAESGKQEADILKQRADEAKIQAEQQHTQLSQEFQNLQRSQVQLDLEHKNLRDQHTELKNTHSTLETLHTQQLAVIRTNISTIETLKAELAKLENEISLLHTQSTAYDCIRIYQVYPLLLKLKQSFTIDNLSGLNKEDIQPIYQRFIDFMNTQFTQTLQRIKDIESHLTQIGAQNIGHWKNSELKITGLQRFIQVQASDELTWGMYIIYKWCFEKIGPHPSNMIQTIGKITQMLRDPNYVIPDLSRTSVNL